VLVHTCEAITWPDDGHDGGTTAEGETGEQFKRKVRFPNDLYTPKIIIIAEENFPATSQRALLFRSFIIKLRRKK